MSLVKNQTYASPSVPLWLEKDLATSSMGKVVMDSSTQTLSGSAAVKIGTLTLTAGTTWVSLNGWIDIVNTGSATTISLYLGETSTWDSAKSVKLTTITLGGAGAHNYEIVDNLTYYNSSGFSTLGLYVLNETATSTSIKTYPATGSNSYSALPSVSGWSISSNTGAVLFTSG
jgi:hypothetical protein